MYKIILMPLDGSARAEAIIPHVEYLAQLTEATVLFFQVVEPPPIVAGPYDARPLTVPEEDAEVRMQQIDTYLSRWVKRFRTQGISARHIVAQGPIVQTIIEVAAREDADLVAMASHGRSGLTRVFYGSVAAGVLQRIDRPLLLIRAEDEG